MVTANASASDGPVREYHQLAITSQGPSIVALAKAQRRGRDMAFLRAGCVTAVDVVELLSTNFTYKPLGGDEYITIITVT